jgi:hypothetical protein
MGHPDVEQLQDCLQALAKARREALLLELAELERLLEIAPSTSQLRREWRSQQPVSHSVKLRETP